MKKLVIAIDGYSSTGKSSISKLIAKELGLVHIDTGALYRGITFYALQHCTSPDGHIDLPELFNSFNKIMLEFRNEDGKMVLYLNHQNIDREIRDQHVSDQVSFIAKQKPVRDFLLETQRNMAKKGGVIMDGRDIGTVILPNADLKFFLTASADARADRRFRELQQLGIPQDREVVKENLIARDKTDSEREIAPLKQADNAILIDNTEMSREETLAAMLSRIADFQATRS